MDLVDSVHYQMLVVFIELYAPYPIQSSFSFVGPVREILQVLFFLILRNLVKEFTNIQIFNFVYSQGSSFNYENSQEL